VRQIKQWEEKQARHATKTESKAGKERGTKRLGKTKDAGKMSLQSQAVQAGK
jgi:hypothetical protein